MLLEIRPARESDVREFIAWRHDPPYDAYNVTGDEETTVDYFSRPEIRCHAILADGELAGFCTFGPDGRVPGGRYPDDGTDIGLAIRPSLTGTGRGRFWARAISSFAKEYLGADPLRVTVALGNERALRTWRGIGFVETQRFAADHSVMGSNLFVVLESRSADG